MTLRTRSAALALSSFLALVGCAGGKGEAREESSGAKVETRATSASVSKTPDAEFRAKQPGPIDQPLQFAAPNPAQRKLSNGLPVLIQENHRLPLVVVEVVVKTGVNGDPEKFPGLSDFVANMLDEGTNTRSAQKIAEELEDLAAGLSASSGLEATRVHLNCLQETLPQALDVLADVVQHPAFRPADFERVRGLKVTELLAKKGIPAAVASDQMARLLYGEKHPWGKPAGGTPESLAAMKPADLAKWHAQYFHPNNAQISISGDVKPEEAVKLLEARFGTWKSHPVVKPKLPTFPVLKASHIALADRPNGSQSQVWMGTRLFAATDPDAIPMFVANNILGGLFMSRLNQNLREDKAYSYGVHSQVALNHSSGAFIAAGGIVAKNTVDAVREYLKEFKSFSTSEVTQSEIDRAKSAMIRSLPSVLETNDAVASALNTLVVKGLPLDYYETLPERVSRVDIPEVKAMAEKYVAPVRWQVVVVGPRAVAEEGLKGLGLGKVEVVSDATLGGGAPGASK